MTKKKTTQKNKFPVPLVALVGGGILLVAVALFFVFGNADGGGTPQLTVDQELIDYGDVTFNTPKTFSIKVTNTGDGVLRFKEKPYIQILEGC
uniref:DUF1573 domain-containing protein n=1 Tax=Anaerolinea thermolimosa TaxID=229919 RepID=A0A7C4KGH9_9CHLR